MGKARTTLRASLSATFLQDVVKQCLQAGRGRLLSLCACLPPGSASLRCPEKRREGTERRGQEGSRRWTVNMAWRGRQVQLLAVSRWSPVPSSMPGIKSDGGKKSRQWRERKERRKLASVGRDKYVSKQLGVLRPVSK